ncbi:MAG: M15 family metallopeptidase [Actinomycetota bacterium]
MSDRRLETLPLLAPPPDDTYAATIQPVPDDVLARSSWVPECPVTVEELSYLTMSHWGFDGEHHTGEMIVHASVAEDVVGVFEQLHAARFPIEQMKVTTLEEVDDHPTGDWNETNGFVCRPAVGSSNWSMHAFGLAVDINPFHNPYLKGDLVIPELASDYVDRERVLPGMILDGDVVVQAFADIGWPWGGDWRSLKDWMHFSQSGR